MDDRMELINFFTVVLQKTNQASRRVWANSILNRLLHSTKNKMFVFICEENFLSTEAGEGFS